MNNLSSLSNHNLFAGRIDSQNKTDQVTDSGGSKADQAAILRTISPLDSARLKRASATIRLHSLQSGTADNAEKSGLKRPFVGLHALSIVKNAAAGTADSASSRAQASSHNRHLHAFISGIAG